MRRKDKFDAILVETTGLADPAPVIQTFFVDDELSLRTTLDAVVTVVDSVHILQQLIDSHEAEEQIAFADIILLNKCDLADENNINEAERRIQRINPYARVQRTHRCDIELDHVLARGAFDLNRILELEPAFLSDTAHAHDDEIISCSLSTARPVDTNRFMPWIRTLIARDGRNILRSKGILSLSGDDHRFVFQGVHMLLDGDRQRPWLSGEPRTSRIVFIGRGLDENALRAGFESCLS
jgi:G3E family GTPase